MSATAHRRNSPPVRVILQFWLGSRMLLLIVAILLALDGGRSLADMAAHWDVQHFLRIAREGYGKENSEAFFPGLPLLLRGSALLGIPDVVGGILLSLVGALAAGMALLRLGNPRQGMWAACAWLIAPTAVFTAVPYTESLFCAAAFWAWERARARDWATMAALAALACTLRISGLFLLVALAVLMLTRPAPTTVGQRLRPTAWLLPGIAVLASYTLFQWWRTGDPIAWYSAQVNGWSRDFHWPWDSFLHTLSAAIPTLPAYANWAWVFRAEVVSMTVGMAATVILLRRRQWGEATWVGVQVAAFTASYWWMSVNRAVLLWFPVWLLMGELVDARPRRTSSAVLHLVVVAVGAAAFLTVLVAWARTFFLGLWSS